MTETLEVQSGLKEIETTEVVIPNNTPILSHTDILSVEYAGRKIRYSILADGVAVISAYDLFSILFSGASVYPHLENIELKGIDAITEDGQSRKDKFFTFSKVNKRILEYIIPLKTYNEKPENYKVFCDFVTAGGVQFLADSIGLNEKFAAKDISHLPKDGTPQKENAQPIQQQPQNENSEVLAAIKGIIKDLKTLDGNQQAFEQTTTGTLLNFKEGIETIAKTQAESIEALKAALLEQKKAMQAQIQQQQADVQQAIESAQSQAIGQMQAQNGIDPLRQKLTNQKIWLRIAFAVTLIFLPFTSAGLFKYINIYQGESSFGYFFVGLLCVAIAAVWDFSILLFSINNKTTQATIGAFVQGVFISAKFDLLQVVLNDLTLADGAWWQKMAVIACAVFYTPYLLANVGDLAAKAKNDNEK